MKRDLPRAFWFRILLRRSEYVLSWCKVLDFFLLLHRTSLASVSLDFGPVNRYAVNDIVAQV